MSRTRGPNETALELLQRFDQALAQAISQGIFTNEINPRNAGVVRNNPITRRQAPANIRDAARAVAIVNQELVSIFVPDSLTQLL